MGKIGYMNLVWHRGDLRTHDHPALDAAVQAGPTAGIVVLDPSILDHTSPRRVAWFYQNTRALLESYSKRGGVLLVRTGKPWEVLPKVVAELKVRRVFALGSYTPYGLARDQQTETALQAPLNWFAGSYIQEPGTITKPDGGAYSVFTPYSKRWWAMQKPKPSKSPQGFAPLTLPENYPLGKIPPARCDISLPPPGEDMALETLDDFLGNKLAQYDQTRDRLDGSGGSRLSYYFNIGALSPRLAAHRAMLLGGQGLRKWMNELCWRDFSGDLLYHHPQMMHSTFDPRWNVLPWTDDREIFTAWLGGQTGIPVVDACMRELGATGFMSNRGRMLVAQFAVKLALLPWQKCERAFRNLLLDGDNASNLQGWQWAGGLGVDAAPYFRVFNLTTQAQTHDPDGSWLRKWVPESGGNPQHYKPPVVNLASARKRYLEAAASIAKTQDKPSVQSTHFR